MLDAPAPELVHGCCTYGAHFTGKKDRKRVQAYADRLTAEQWQYKDEAERRGGPIHKDDDGNIVSELVDDACIFLNRLGFGAGPGCALHQAAVAADERPLDWKPEVCWQLPLRLDNHVDDNGHLTWTLREWKRRDWGEGGDDFHWWCTEGPEAFVDHRPGVRDAAGRDRRDGGPGALRPALRLREGAGHRDPPPPSGGARGGPETPAPSAADPLTSAPGDRKGSRMRAFTAENLAQSCIDEGLLLPAALRRAAGGGHRRGQARDPHRPAGHGKTTLAYLAADVARKSMFCTGFLPTTATSEWTTFETIGGLQPTADGLIYRPGLFVEAIESGRWLVIDELNRSNFDRAFGQLFTVLAGQPVVLPFHRKGQTKPISLVPSGEDPPEKTDMIRVPANWRILATMNVFDKNLLFDMSYALMRRFAFIEVGTPSDERLPAAAAGPGRARHEAAAAAPAVRPRARRSTSTPPSTPPGGPRTWPTSPACCYEVFYAYFLPAVRGHGGPPGRRPVPGGGPAPRAARAPGAATDHQRRARRRARRVSVSERAPERRRPRRGGSG